MSPVRIALKEQVSRGQVEDFAWNDGWSMWDMMEGVGLEPYVKIYRTQDDLTAAHYIEDPTVDIHYFALEGADVDGTARQIRAGLPTYSRAEVLQTAKTASEPLELARTVRVAGVTASEPFDREIFEIITNAMSNPDPRVRISGVAATAFAAWKEFREPLERLRADAEPQVADFAQVVLRGLTEKNWKES
jgi:hypothetical protein